MNAHIHYLLLRYGKYTVEITMSSGSGGSYTVSYTVDKIAHKAYINGKEVRVQNAIRRSYGGIRSTPRGKFTYQNDVYLRYVDDGNPDGGPIKYAHPFRDKPYWYNDDYSIGTWETVTLIGKNYYHTQIGTDDIGWLVDLPPAVVGAAIGALIGAVLGSVVGAVIGAVIGVVIGFISGNIIRKYVCDETGAGWMWISKSSVRDIV